MAVALVHYHIAPGGVGSVIARTSAGLRGRGVPHVILCGAVPEEELGLPVRAVRGLGYLGARGGDDSAALARRMRAAARDALGEDPQVWHFHNHSLGKNILLAGAVAQLARDGERLILQIHDLAEDGRPANHAALAGEDMLYPAGSHIHYAFINRRDRQRFLDAGLPPAQAIYLPDPLDMPTAPAATPVRENGPPLVLSAARGIRRKNLGEICLLAALAADGARFATTLPPQSPAWLPGFRAWQEFAAAARLPVGFGVVGRNAPDAGYDMSYRAWRERASHHVTTSVAEGFGFGFLEPLALGKPSFGRDLAEITRDFTALGITPGRLYAALRVPAGCLDMTELRRRTDAAVRQWLAAYGKPAGREFLSRASALVCHHGTPDFANLPEDMQRSVVSRVAAGRAEILAEGATGSVGARAWLAEAVAQRNAATPPEMLAAFSTRAHAERLVMLYETAVRAPVSAVTALDRARVLAAYLTPEAFHFLRC